MQVAILKKKLHDKLGRLVEELNLTPKIRSFVMLYQRLLTGDNIKSVRLYERSLCLLTFEVRTQIG